MDGHFTVVAPDGERSLPTPWGEPVRWEERFTREIVSIEEAEERGLTIDPSTKPRVVFEGPRFQRLALVAVLVPAHEFTVITEPQEAHPHE